MALDAFEQSTNFSSSLALAPLGEPCAQVQSKDAQIVSGRHYLKKRMFGSGRVMPLMISNLNPAQVSDRMRALGCPKRKSRRLGQCFDYSGVGGLLEDDQVRRYIFDHFSQT
jgi:hypothetical protein